MEHNNIILLAKNANFKKIKVRKDSWAETGWCIVESVVIKSDGIYGFAYGHIHYNNGKTFDGKINGAGTYNWTLLEILNEDMEVNYL